ncbi:MAG TPA: hypothetical protein VFC78_17795 [Tepidisphaeraceae bacterium]|nr:hypothetical protein [Tepidisphaeraceae bacterium]
MSGSPAFLADVLVHFAQFLQDNGVTANDVVVRLTLVDGSSFFVQGFKVSPPLGAQGLGMINGIGADARSALIIRESHVIKAELQIADESKGPIGFHGEHAGS